MGSWLKLEREGVSLACLDFGGDGPPVLLLHGLAGHAAEWAETAGWLTAYHRVLALEQRGHGRSDRAPTDVSRAAYVIDAVAVIEAFALQPVILIGESLGGHTAFLVAAERPDLVRALIVVEASAGGPDREAPERVARALASWPVPFPSLDEATKFFGGPSTVSEAWVSGLEQGDEGWAPWFDPSVMVDSLREVAARSWWREWDMVECPTLIVRAEHGFVSPADAQRMARHPAAVELVEIPSAGHDVHLEQPAVWREVILRFLADIS